MMTFGEKLPAELPHGSPYPDGSDYHREMEVWGRALDRVEAENIALETAIVSPAISPDWGIQRWEKEFSIFPSPVADITSRRLAVLTAMKFRRDFRDSAVLAAAELYLGYKPVIKTAPHSFYLGRSTFADGHSLVAPHIRWSLFIQLDAVRTARPFDDIPLIEGIKSIAPADLCTVWSFWSDEYFDWRDYFTWATARFTARHIAARYLGYFPYVKMPPSPQWFGIPFTAARPLVADHIHRSFFVEIDAAKTAGGWDATAMLAAIQAALPPTMYKVYAYRTDAAFSWNNFNP